MKQTNSRIALASGAALLLALAVFPRHAAGQQQPPGGRGAAGGGAGGGFARGGQPFDYNDNEGWLSLFDGKTLNGWDGDSRFWSVKDGAIYVEPTCEKPTGTIYIIWQGGELSDFILKFDSKGTETVNGGVQFRSYLTADPNVMLRYPGRGGGGTVVNAAAAAAAAARAGGGGAGRGPGAGRGGGGGGRGPCANPGTPPTTEEKAKWDMAGPQFDFDATNRYSGQYYEQLSVRGIAAAPGTVVLAEPGVRRVIATIADKPTLDSWFHKDDYNQFMLIAKGHVTTMFMNGHLVSEFIDNDADYFRPSGKLGIEVESYGAYSTKNIYLKRLR